MNRFLKRPVINAVCLSLFTAFYALVFIMTANSAAWKIHLGSSCSETASPLFSVWHDFLRAGGHAFLAYGLIAVTAVVVFLLLRRRKPYDEYHISLLKNCLVISLLLCLAAIALFYLAVLSDTSGILEKFTLFVVLNWGTIVFADLAFVLLCQWR